jgi:tetratricopeptide (TPR) repeat protein
LENLSNRNRSIIVGLAIASFFLTIVAFYNLVPRAGIDPNIFVVLSLVASAFVSYFFITVFGIVKEFSLKGASFEFTSKLEEVKEDIKETKEEVATGLSSISNAVQNINTRIDTVITNQFTNTNRLDQRNEIYINNLETQNKVRKLVAEESGVSPTLPVPGPKATPSDSKKTSHLVELLKFLSEKPTGLVLSVESELNKAYALIVEGKYEEALKTYDSIIAEKPYNTEALLRKGICLYYLGRRNNSPEFHRESIKMYDKVLEFDPKNKRALHMKGVACYYLGKIPLANKYYDKVLEIDPNFGVSLYNKACNFARSGKTKEALEYLRRAISSEQRFKQWANNDEAFKALKGNPEFEKMFKFDFNIEGSA